MPISSYYSFIYISFIEDEEKKEKPIINYNDLIATNSDKKNMYVSIEIADIPYQIAQREVNYTYINTISYMTNPTICMLQS